MGIADSEKKKCAWRNNTVTTKIRLVCLYLQASPIFVSNANAKDTLLA